MLSFDLLPDTLEGVFKRSLKCCAVGKDRRGVGFFLLSADPNLFAECDFQGHPRQGMLLASALLFYVAQKIRYHLIGMCNRGCRLRCDA